MRDILYFHKYQRIFIKTFIHLILIFGIFLIQIGTYSYIFYDYVCNPSYGEGLSMKNEIEKLLGKKTQDFKEIPLVYLNTYFETVDGIEMIKVGIIDKDHQLYLRDEKILSYSTGLEFPYALETPFIIFLFESEEDRYFFYETIQKLYRYYQQKNQSNLIWCKNQSFIRYAVSILQTPP